MRGGGARRVSLCKEIQGLEMRIVTELPLEGDAPVHRIDGAGLCNLLAISPAMLTELKHRGMAVHHGRDAWNLEETVRAYVTHLRGIASGRGGEEQALNLTTERARLAKEQADAQAIKNAALRRDLVPAVEVERAWADALRGLRSRLLAVPSRVRAAQGHLTAADIEALDREIRATLTELGTDAGEADDRD